MPNFFEYEGKEYCLMGYTGGELPSASDFEMSFYPASTAHASGHCMFYGIDDVNRLVVKKIEVYGEEKTPIRHHYTMTKTDSGDSYYYLNEVIPITGYILFSDLLKFRRLYHLGTFPIFELKVDEGQVESVIDVSDSIKEKIQGRDERESDGLFRGTTDEERLANLEQVWDITAIILPRRYDSLYTGIWYFNFRERIEDYKNKIAAAQP